MAKTRKKFYIFNCLQTEIGYGVYYPHGGNCQVYFYKDNHASIQVASLGEVMHYDGVFGIEWDQEITNKWGIANEIHNETDTDHRSPISDTVLG